MNYIDIHNLKSSTISPSNSKEDLFKTLVYHGRIIHNDNDDDIIHAGECSNNGTSTNGNERKHNCCVLLDILVFTG